ncbi:hypothetical protein [Nannocystis punicea]|uniref:Uncharacterized protein n=1 Tax=Nannocystis punicea TaxID=2995304 RepID=A0ABY7GSA4_9BACT|nr:hypothetical protein [Nannocystis poenicansa]WAS89754.1 hypothetical protein O0S08_26475 [Nannocystis poenicansa]
MRRIENRARNLKCRPQGAGAGYLVWAAIVAGACGDEGTGSSGGTEGASGVTTSTTEPGSTSLESTTGAVEPTTDAVEPTTDTGASSGDTGGEDACAAFCAAVVACAPTVIVEECIAEFCGDEGATPACVAATDARHMCFASMSCDDILVFLNEDDPGPCSEAVAQEVESCTGQKACEYEANGTVDGSACSIDFECIGEPPQAMQCDTETCTCIEDGSTTGTCASEGICANVTDLDSVQLLVELAATCCSFGPAA